MRILSCFQKTGRKRLWPNLFRKFRFPEQESLMAEETDFCVHSSRLTRTEGTLFPRCLSQRIPPRWTFWEGQKKNGNLEKSVNSENNTRLSSFRNSPHVGFVVKTLTSFCVLYQLLLCTPFHEPAWPFSLEVCGGVGVLLANSTKKPGCTFMHSVFHIYLYSLCIQSQAWGSAYHSETKKSKWESGSLFRVRRFLTKVHFTYWCIWSTQDSWSFPSLSWGLGLWNIGEAGFPRTVLSLNLKAEQSPGSETVHTFKLLCGDLRGIPMKPKQESPVNLLIWYLPYGTQV